MSVCVYVRRIVRTIVSNAMRVFYDYCWLRDLREMSTYELYVKPAVVGGLGGVKLSLPWHYPTKMSLGNARSHKLGCLFVPCNAGQLG